MGALKGTAMAAAVLGALATGLAWAGLRERAGGPSGPPATRASGTDPGEGEGRPGAPEAGGAPDIRGKWEILYLTGTVAGRREGYPTPGLIVPVADETINFPALTGNPRDPMSYRGEMRYALDPGRKSGAIDLKGGPGGGKVLRGIYRLKGDILTICFRGPDDGRPETFAGDRPSEGVIVLRRIPAESAPPHRPGDPLPPPTGPAGEESR